jgi:hypothetical protein
MSAASVALTAIVPAAFTVAALSIVASDVVVSTFHATEPARAVFSDPAPPIATDQIA